MTFVQGTNLQTGQGWQDAVSAATVAMASTPMDTAGSPPLIAGPPGLDATSVAVELERIMADFIE